MASGRRTSARAAGIVVLGIVALAVAPSACLALGDGSDLHVSFNINVVNNIGFGNGNNSEEGGSASPPDARALAERLVHDEVEAVNGAISESVHAGLWVGGEKYVLPPRGHPSAPLVRRSCT